MLYASARPIAEDYLKRLSPYCAQIEIAGSLRRHKTDVHDIELVLQPKFEPGGLFLDPVNRLSHVIPEVFQDCMVHKNGERMKQIALPQGINLELYIVLPPAHWGVIYAIRTGSAEFSHWLVTPRKYRGACPSHRRVENGAVWESDRLVETPTEESFFEALWLDWLEPDERTGPRPEIVQR